MDYPVLYHENQKVGSFIAEFLNHGNEILQTQKQELKTQLTIDCPAYLMKTKMN